MELQPQGHHDGPNSPFNLADSLQTRYEESGSSGDPEEAIALHCEAPHGDPDRPISLSNLHERSDVLKELEEAIDLHRGVLELRPQGHPDRPSSLYHLANSLRIRHETSGRMGDLEEAIGLHREVLQLLPQGHPGGLASLIDLAVSLQSRFEHSRISKDLEEAIALGREAQQLLPHGHPNRTATLHNLAASLQSRYEQSGMLNDLEEATALHRDILQLRPNGHPDRPFSLTYLAGLLRNLYEQTGATNDLKEAITMQREALQLRPEGHPNRAECLGNLAGSLQNKYEHSGVLDDLEESITLQRKALQLLPHGHYNRSIALSNLAGSLQTRYKLSGTLEDLEDSIILYREVLQPLSHEHPNRTVFLSNLAVSLRNRYQQSGASKDLDEAITLYREALQLQPQGHPNKLIFLSNLANSLRTRYEQSGAPESLEESITLQREVLQQLHHKHPNKKIYLGNLAVSLQSRYEQSGTINDLEEAITLYREALQSQPQGHPERPTSLGNLAHSLRTRYEHSGILMDLEEAIALDQEVLRLRPHGQPSRSVSLSNLAVSLHHQSERSGALNDLDEIIILNREALQLQPRGHPDRSTSLSNLAGSLHNRYEQYGFLKDLEEAIGLHREALELRPHGHPSRSISLSNLAGSLRIQCEQSSTPGDLEEVITFYQEALQLQPHGHPNRSLSLHHIAQSMTAMHRPNNQSETVSYEIQQLALEAVDYNYTSVEARLEFALYWTKDFGMDIDFRLQMHKKSLLLLQQMLLINPDFTHQQLKLSELSRRVSAASAAATAIQVGNVKEAVGLLDLGRSVFLSTLQRYRTPLDDLSALDSSLANELKDVGSQLENLAMLQNLAAKLPGYVTALDHALNTQRKLIRRWDDLISRIRKLPGFEDFLGTPSYNKLQAAAEHGPIIFLNASEIRCDAIIIPPAGEPTLIPLLGTSWTKLEELVEILEQTRSSNNPNKRFIDLLHVLRSLWSDVVSPVLKELSSLGFKPDPRNRVWWCPTSWFTMLPIHAAGMYNGSKSSTLPELFISSYISTITSLLRSMHKNASLDNSPTSSALFIGHTDNESLEGVETELKSLQEVKTLKIESLVNDAATPNAVLEGMKHHSWTHLSCHGLVEHDAPLRSHFMLEGGDLHVQDIIKARLDNAEFAFLSACHSAAGSRAMLDETLHLTSALQFAGFRSVVGTMWEMHDPDAPELTRDFYDAMVKLGGRYDNAAVALHYALKRFRKRAGPDRWAMFIHVGA
jgi:tetratricopeptide (TPR) repeat protein/CHAT domain-containing protein